MLASYAWRLSNVAYYAPRKQNIWYLIHLEPTEQRADDTLDTPVHVQMTPPSSTSGGDGTDIILSPASDAEQYKATEGLCRYLDQPSKNDPWSTYTTNAATGNLKPEGNKEQSEKSRGWEVETNPKS
jgi:hypothetical protein